MMLRRHISVIMVVVFIGFILINFIFSYSLFKFYKSAQEEIEQEISREEREEDAVKSGEELKEPKRHRQTTRLHFHNDESLNLNTVDDSDLSLQTQESLTVKNVTEKIVKPLESKKQKPLSTNFTTTIEPKPEYYNSDEYYGDSNENLDDKNYNNYDDKKFLVITSPGIQPENNKI